MNKYRNEKIKVDGITFDSKKESERYLELKLLERAGCIKELELQKSFEIQPAFSFKNKKIRAIKYVCDFYYYDNDRRQYVVEDTKGMRTKEYLLKKKLFEYKYGIEIEEK